MKKNKHLQKNILLSIIIVNYNTAEVTMNCLKSIYKNTKNLNFEIILVDNNSKAEDYKYLSKNIKQFMNIKLVKSRENIGFGGGNNLGLKNARGRYILFLNSDTLIQSNLLIGMINWMDKNAKVGLSSCALKNLDGSFQQNGGYFPNLLNVFIWMLIKGVPFVDEFIKPFHPKINFYKEERDIDWVTGAFMLFRNEVLNETFEFDTDYFMYTEDVDLCYRVKKHGWEVRYLPKWKITHLGGGSSNKEFALLSEFKGVKTFFKKHYPNWQLPVVRLFLKLGSLWRIFLISPKIYVKAFIKA